MNETIEMPFEPTEDQLGAMMLAWLEGMYPNARDLAVSPAQLEVMRSVYKAAWRAAQKQ